MKEKNNNDSFKLAFLVVALFVCFSYEHERGKDGKILSNFEYRPHNMPVHTTVGQKIT
jgi:hypothetical protein